VSASDYFNIRRHILFGEVIAEEANGYLDRTLEGRKFVSMHLRRGDYMR
jgi:hypothetical protein